MLKKSFYYDEDHFDLEKELIFSNGWVFACLLDEVKLNNDFATLDIAGIPVVIQNFKGELRAFLNVCTHRFNKIQTEEFGRRALTCGYHCWSFNQDGYPFFVPKKDLFSEFKTEMIGEEFCLKKFQVDVCGNFVFICLNKTKLSLKEHLETYYDKLIDISSHIGKKIHTGLIDHNANWKVLVENVLECYHCSVVHKDTLYGNLGIGGLPISEIAYSSAHSSCHFPKVQKVVDTKKKKILSFLDQRQFKHDSFYHIFIFPNLLISSTEGASFYVGQLFPVSAIRTDLKIRFFEPNLNYENVNLAIREVLAEESINFGYRILEEDKAILEQIQQGIKWAQSPGIINDEEIRIKYFFDKYHNVINE